MSADDFDPAIERLFSRSAPMADADVFTASVERRLARGGRVRAIALSAAGVVGGLVAVREAMGFRFGAISGLEQLGGGVEAASASAQTALVNRLDQVGLGFLDLAATGSMQWFWIAASVMVAAALMGAVRLSQDI